MYELAVCSDGMTSASPQSFHQNKPASQYMKIRCEEVLNTRSNVQFPRKIPIFKAGKNANFALQHHIIFGVLVSP